MVLGFEREGLRRPPCRCHPGQASRNPGQLLCRCAGQTLPGGTPAAALLGRGPLLVSRSIPHFSLQNQEKDEFCQQFSVVQKRLEQWFLTRGYLAGSGDSLVITAGDRRQHYWHLVGGGQDKHPTMHRTAHTYRNYPVQPVNSAEVQKPWTKGSLITVQKQSQPWANLWRGEVLVFYSFQQPVLTPHPWESSAPTWLLVPLVEGKQHMPTSPQFLL